MNLQSIPVTPKALLLLVAYITAGYAQVQTAKGSPLFYRCPKCLQPATIISSYIGGQGYGLVLQCLYNWHHFTIPSPEEKIELMEVLHAHDTDSDYHTSLPDSDR